MAGNSTFNPSWHEKKMNIKWLVKSPFLCHFNDPPIRYSFCIIAKNIPKPKINWLFFVLGCGNDGYVYIDRYALFSSGSGCCVHIYFHILFGLPVTLAIHIIIRYRVTWKMNLFLDQIFMSAFGHTNNLRKIVGIWMMWTFVLERIFQIHFVFSCCVYTDIFCCCCCCTLRK